jgi:hypothetical protein
MSRFSCSWCLGTMSGRIFSPRAVTAGDERGNECNGDVTPSMNRQEPRHRLAALLVIYFVTGNPFSRQTRMPPSIESTFL